MLVFRFLFAREQKNCTEMKAEEAQREVKQLEVAEKANSYAPPECTFFAAA